MYLCVCLFVCLRLRFNEDGNKSLMILLQKVVIGDCATPMSKRNNANCQNCVTNGVNIRAMDDSRHEREMIVTLFMCLCVCVREKQRERKRED